MEQAKIEAQHIKQVIEEMEILNISPSVAMSINTDSSAGKAVASQLGLNKKTKHVKLRYLYMQLIIQRGEITITRIPTTDNPADVLTTTLTSTVGSLLGVPTATRLTLGVISAGSSAQQQQQQQQQQPQPTPAAESRLGLRLSQAQQYRRRKRNAIGTPPRRQQLLDQQSEQDLAVQNRELVLGRRQLPWSFFVSLVATLILCLHYSYFGSTISPPATVRQFVADSVGTMADFPLVMVMESNGDMTLPGLTIDRTCRVTVKTLSPETISEEVLEDGREEDNEQHRQITARINANRNNVDEDGDVSMNDRGAPTVTIQPQPSPRRSQSAGSSASSGFRVTGM
eukprot:6037077-Amphidinium_carterae.1